MSDYIFDWRLRFIKLKERIFNRGAKAYQQVFGGNGTTYVCPLCVQAFTKEDQASGELTLEHIPPKAVGGRGLCLTCKTCNNTAGYTVDANLSNQQKMWDFVEALLTGKKDDSIGDLRILGNQLTVRVSAKENGVDLHIKNEHNNPRDIIKFRKNLEQSVDFRSGNFERMSQ